MEIVIIEDEELAVEILADTIMVLRPESKIIKSLSSIKEAVKWFENNTPPDLIFCDIHLADGKSFEIFKKVEVKSPVIFTTAYDQYAIEAFRVNSIDYLLKPIKKEDVENSLKKFEDLQKDQLLKKFENMQSLLGSFSKPKTFRKRFTVKQGQSMKTVPSEEVAGFLAEEGLVFLYIFTGQRFILSNTLEQLEEEVEDSKFFRVNRKFIINIDAIEQVKPYFNSRLIIKSRSPLNFEQIVSTNRVADFKKWLDYFE